MSELCLGTVQFGMKYGVNNTLGQPTLEQSFSMLDQAIESGIKVIDTARAYGEAEEILGKYFRDRKSANKVKVISKLCPNIIENGEKDVLGVVRREIEGSLDRLSIEKLDGYLLHTPEYIYNKDILGALELAKKEKLVDNIGVSIYEIEHGEEAIRSGVVDYVQLPYSILDQRGAKLMFFEHAKKAGIKVFTRSAFLQGLYTMKLENIPQHLQGAVSYLKEYEQIIRDFNLSKMESLIQFVKYEEYIDYLVFGVDTREQLIQDISIFNNTKVNIDFINTVKKTFLDIDKSIIFPSLWSNGKKPTNTK